MQKTLQLHFPSTSSQSTMNEVRRQRRGASSIPPFSPCISRNQATGTGTPWREFLDNTRMTRIKSLLSFLAINFVEWARKIRKGLGYAVLSPGRVIFFGDEWQWGNSLCGNYVELDYMRGVLARHFRGWNICKFMKYEAERYIMGLLVKMRWRIFFQLSPSGTPVMCFWLVTSSPF